MSYTQKYGQAYESHTGHDEDETNWLYVVAGSLMVAAGAYLIFRGVNQEDTSRSSRHDPYAPQRNQGKGIQVKESIVIDKTAAELYRYWRRLENLPRIMSHLESVTETGNRSHWKAKAPLGLSAEWDAVITDDRPDELIAWRSEENAQVPNEGSVRFSGVGSKSVYNPYTVVLVSLTYHPPLGPVGAAVAKLFGREPSQQIREDLQNFKQAVESGTLSLEASDSV